MSLPVRLEPTGVVCASVAEPLAFPFSLAFFFFFLCLAYVCCQGSQVILTDGCELRGGLEKARDIHKLFFLMGFLAHK